MTGELPVNITKSTDTADLTMDNKPNRRYLSLCFLVPCAIMLMVYIAWRVYPFGNESVLVLDLNGQYVYFFEQLRKLIYGEGSFLYSFGRALGGEFFGIYAYYLASPLSYIVALFPKENITEALLCMFLIKTGLCGLTFGVYLDRTRKRSPAATVMFSCMYALTAYAVVMQHNTMWIDNVALLPLITLGIEELIKHGRFKLFVISLTVAVFSNFYIGYMSCIYVAVYFFYYFIANDSTTVNPNGERAHFFKSLCRIALFSAIALCICAVIIMTAYYSLSFGKTTFSDPNYDFKQRFDFADLLSKFYFGSYDTVRPEGLPFVYCGMLTLFLAPLYFISSHISAREKIATGVLAVFFVLSFNASTLDLVWHGFQRPNWLNYRYSYMLCFILILMAAKAYEKIREVNYRTVIAIAAVIALVLAVLQKLEIEPENLSDLGAVWPSLAITAIYLILLRYIIKSPFEQTTSAALAIIVGVELFAAGLVNIVDLDDDVVYSSRTSYRSFIDRVQPAVDLATRGDGTFYRMEKTLHRKTNDNLALGIRGLSNSTSTLNADTILFLNRLGMSSKSHWSKYLGGTPVMDSLLGIKYLVTEKDETVTPLYYKLFTYNNDLCAYENPYALPIAYSSDGALADIALEEYDNPFERMNGIVGAMLGEDTLADMGYAEAEIFVPINGFTTATEGCEVSFTSGHKKYTPTSSGRPAKVVYQLTAKEDGIIYAYFPSDYLREAKLTVNGSDSGTYFANETYRIITLGEFEAGEQLSVTLTIDNDKNEMYIGNAPSYFYYVDNDAFDDAFTALAGGGYAVGEYTEHSFDGTITVPEGDELVYVSIPYDEGWRVKVDGEDAALIEVMESTIAVGVTPGEHTLSLEYRPDAYVKGVALSVAGVVIFAAVCLFDFLMRRYRQKHLPDAANEALPEAVIENEALDESQSDAGHVNDTRANENEASENNAESNSEGESE